MASVLLRDATIVVGTADGARVDDGGMVVADGRFVDVGPVDALTTAADAVVDLGGRVVVPGLWDAHVHLGALVPPNEDGLAAQDPRHHMSRCIAKAQDNLRSGVTTVRSLGERDGADLLLRDLVAAGAVRGPRILAAGDVRWSVTAVGVDAWRGNVRERALAGVDTIKLLVTGGIPFRGGITSPTGNRAEVEAAIAEAHAWGCPVAVHAMGDDAVTMAIECGADTVEHAFGCTPAVADVMAANDVTFCPNLAVTERWTPDEVADRCLPVWMGRNAADARRGHHETFAAAVELGVPVIAGVDNLPKDAGDYGIERVGSVPGLVVELQLMQRLGMSTAQALAAATTNAATAAGRGDEIGTIAPGKVADFVVLDADPLASLANLTAVHSVWQDGARVVARGAQV